MIVGADTGVVVLGALLGAISGAIVTVVGALLVRTRTLAETGKLKAETTDLVTQTATRVLEQVNEQNESMARNIAALWKAVRALAALVVHHGGDPTPVILELEAAASGPSQVAAGAMLGGAASGGD